MNLIKTILGISMIVLAPAALYAGINIHSFYNVCYTYVGFEVTGINNKFISLVAKIEFKNPSLLDMKIHGYTLDASLNGKKVASISNANEKMIPHESKSILAIPINIDYKSVFGALGSAEIITLFSLRQYDQIVLHLKGHIIGGVFGQQIQKEIDLNYNLAEIIHMVDNPEPSKKCV